MSKSEDIPANWWVPQDRDAKWQRHMDSLLDEAVQDLDRVFGKPARTPWEQLPLPFDD